MLIDDQVPLLEDAAPQGTSSESEDKKKTDRKLSLIVEDILQGIQLYYNETAPQNFQFVE